MYIYYDKTALMTFENVCRVNDMRHGDGECIYANGDKYKGEFVENLRHGMGVYTAGFSLVFLFFLVYTMGFSLYIHTRTHRHTHTHTHRHTHRHRHTHTHWERGGCEPGL